MPRQSLERPPTYEQAALEYTFRPEKPALYRIVFNRALDMQVMENRVNLLDYWPTMLSINGKPYPFLKVVFLMANRRWPRGPVYYPFTPCDPREIVEGYRPPPIP
jgi:hypothetical protein